MAFTGSSMPDMSTIVSSRAMASRGVLACSVVSEPSWPVFIAWSMSSVSPERHSVLLRQLQLGRVLHGDDALALGDERADDVQRRRLPGARAPGDDDVLA